MNKNKRLKICSTQNENLNDSICSEFSTICYDAFEEKVIEIGLRDNDLFTSLRPHIFDSLKRINRLTLIKKCILNFMCTRKYEDEKWFHLKQIEERDLICSTIQTLNSSQKLNLVLY
jgi:hypothetical protein